MASLRFGRVIGFCFSLAKLFGAHGACAEPPFQLAWFEALDPRGGGDYGYGDVSLDGDGAIYVAGSTQGDVGGINPDPSSFEAVLYKLASDGSVAWIRQTEALDHQVAGGVAVAASGHAYLCGTTNGLFDGIDHDEHGFLSQYDASGNLNWVKFTAEPNTSAIRVAADAAGNAYLAVDRTNVYGKTGIVEKYDDAGTRLWSREFNGSRLLTTSTSITDIAVDHDSNAVITGWTNGELAAVNDGVIDAFVAKIGSEGEVDWVRQIGGSSSVSGAEICVDPLGNIW